MSAPILDMSDPAAIARAVKLLRGGGVIAFPTDTVYGIGAHGLIGAAVERLYVIKARPNDKSIPLLLASVDDVSQAAREVTPAAAALMRRHWPGALTIVLRKQPHLPDAVSNRDTVAVRVPDHADVRALIRALGAPLAATSANRSGRPELLDAAAIAAELGAELDLILDGGPLHGGVPSTVVDATVEPVRVLRAGAIKPEQL
ncbi:MAG: threonylcarbamoyl-AMP synthase [Chloroflexi bacterium]|nr:threonylcarbamoyl-AMP synthase [Chloroflexota bacterium]